MQRTGQFEDRGAAPVTGDGDVKSRPARVVARPPPVVVTRAGASDRSALKTSDPRRQARVHIEFLDRFDAVGVVAAGWLVDPLERISAVLLDCGAGEATRLGAIAELLTSAECYEAFDIPRDTAAKYGFVLRLAEPRRDELSRLTLELRLERGGRQRCALSPTGAAGRLAEIIARTPLSYGLSVVRRLTADAREGGPRTPALPPEIGELLTAVHERIDPRRNYGSEGDGASVECQVEGAIRVGTEGIVVTGWILHDDTDQIQEAAVVSLFGRRVVLDAPLPAMARPDVIGAKAAEIASRNHDCGFVAFAAVPRLAGEDRAWFLELVMKGGVIKRCPFICPATPESFHGISLSLGLVQEKARDLPDLFRRAISPAADWFWAATRRNNPPPAEIAYGIAPTGPEVSIVVPLYGRIDLMRYQIATFSNDDAFNSTAARVELIYVLDDPAAEDAFLLLSRHLYDLYRVPFRTLLLKRNLGYSAANNFGAAAATGGLLLFLNSDVLPARPGWVGQLSDAYRALDHCGILGCRLLFEDGSIQHAGMTFRASTLVPGCWENDHPGKGLPAAFDPHRKAVAVPAVTAACLIVDRALFHELGGMSEDYVIGDFEDSDLCLRAQDRGWKVYYTPEIELFHLERQSMRLIDRNKAGWRQNLTLYNMWKHSRRWGSLIPVVLDRSGG
jgi:GT2 family glycosyltransferase